MRSYDPFEVGEMTAMCTGNGILGANCVVTFTDEQERGRLRDYRYTHGSPGSAADSLHRASTPAYESKVVHKRET